MRIVIFGINYWPEETGIAPFTTGRAEHLAARGHEVTVVTGFPYYPAWRVADAYRGRIIQRETRAGVRILRTWLYVPRRATSARRVIHEATFVASSIARALTGVSRPDVLFVVSPPLSLALAAVTLARIWRRRFVFHVEDLQPDAAIELGMLSRSGLVRALYALEAIAYRRAALITTLNEGIRRRIVAKGVEEQRVGLCAHWADRSLFALASRDGGARFRSWAGLNGEFIAAHCGNMGVKQALDVVVDAAAVTRDRPDLLYTLAGDGVRREAIHRRIVNERLCNVRLLPVQPRERFRDLLSATGVALLAQQRSVTDIAFPSKVETFMAAGLPIVASVNAASTVAAIVRDAGAGVVVEPENASLLADAIIELMADPAARAVMGARGRQYARTTWNDERALAAFESMLAEVAHARTGGAVRFAEVARFSRSHASAPRSATALGLGAIARAGTKRASAEINR